MNYYNKKNKNEKLSQKSETAAPNYAMPKEARCFCIKKSPATIGSYLIEALAKSATQLIFKYLCSYLGESPSCSNSACTTFIHTLKI
jgi:hypothetical protein